MLQIQNPDGSEINVQQLKAEILADQVNEPDVSEIEIQADLANMYKSAADQITPLLYNAADTLISARSEHFSATLAGGNIWKRLKTFVCTALQATSTEDDIINVVLDFLASVMPFGIVIGAIVKKIIRYILKKGIDGFCGFPLLNN
jgi:hypothetical protein